MKILLLILFLYAILPSYQHDCKSCCGYHKECDPQAGSISGVGRSGQGLGSVVTAACGIVAAAVIVTAVVVAVLIAVVIIVVAGIIVAGGIPCHCKAGLGSTIRPGDLKGVAAFGQGL